MIFFPSLRRTTVAFAALVSALLAAPAFGAPPEAVRLMLDEKDVPAAARLPDHARAGGNARAGQFNNRALQAGRVTVELPGGRNLVAARGKEMRGNRGEVSWTGEFEGQPGSLLAMTSYKGRLTGFMNHGEEIWELTTGEDGVTLLFQVDEAALPSEADPIHVFAEDGDYVYSLAELEAEAATAGDPVVQDILVAYTAAAVSRAGSVATIESRILNAVAAANSAYVNSNVGIRLNVVGLHMTDYVETGDITLSLSRLRGTADGYMDEVHSLRNQLGADLVALISEDTNACGVAYVMSNPSSGFASSAFSVTRQGCFGGHTFAHEIGHNQGNAHDRKNGGSSAYPYSFGYRTCDNIAPSNGQSFRTVMAYSCTGSRVNYFSNPNVYYNGAPMGVHYELDPANSADNARSMNNTAPITAAFRGSPSDPPPAAPTNLQGSASSHDRVQLGWNDNSNSETGFTLQRAVNGGSFSDRASLSANTASFTDTGVSGGTTYSYRVRAWNSTGNSEFSNTVTLVTPSAPPPPIDPAPASVSLSSSTATVSWTDVANESYYEIFRETLNTKNGRWGSATTLMAPADSTSLVETLSSGTYRYKVRAVGGNGNSNWIVADCSGCASDGSFTVSATSSGSSPKGGKGNNKDEGEPGGGKGNSKDESIATESESPAASGPVSAPVVVSPTPAANVAAPALTKAEAKQERKAAKRAAKAAKKNGG